MLFALSATVLAMAMFAAAPAAADEVDTDKFPNRISGNVQLNGQPLEDVRLVITGNGVDTEVETDAAGKWAVGVPEKNADYTVTLDESTLPEGIAVIDETGADETPNVREVTVGPGGRVTANFFIGQGERNTISFFDQLVERAINGLNFGLMLGLAAVGLNLVYGTTRLANFAHAEMVTVGAVVAFSLGVAGLPIWLAIPLAVIIGGLIGFGLDVVLWKPLRSRGIGIVQLMIVSIGLSLALRYLIQYFIGGGTLQLEGASSPKLALFGSVRLSVIDMWSMGISVVVILVFAWWLFFTRVGKATRAISDNSPLAAASGIDVDRVVRIVWVVAGALAALSGILYAYFRPGIKWDMGAHILLLVFAAVTLGGLGTALGGLVGAVIVGLLIEISGLWIPADLKYVGGLGVLIVILLFRPQGLLGRRERIG